MVERRINFDRDYVDKILKRKKVTTIRRGIKRYPVGELVDLTVDYKPFVKARVDKVVVKRVNELTEEDAIKDGFKSRAELISALKEIYGDIKDKEFITIVHFTIVD